MSPRAVLQMDPSVGSMPPKSRENAALSAPKSLTVEYLNSQSYGAIHAKLQGLPQTAETLRIKAEILAQCGKRSDRQERKETESKEEKRAKFIASLPVNHPSNEVRIRAYDLSKANPCEGVPEVATNKSEIDAAFKLAFEAGDPVAKARAIECSFPTETPRNPQTGMPIPDKLTDEQFASFKEILASKNPRAIDLLGGLMASTYGNGSIQIISNEAPTSNNAVRKAVELLACDYGLACDNVVAQRPRACALEGKCNSGTLADHINFYEASPAVSQEIERVRGVLQGMIERNDFSDLKFIKSDAPPNGIYMFKMAGCE